MTKKELREHYRGIYPHYRVSSVAMSMAQNKVPQETMEAIMAGGESVRIGKDNKGRTTMESRIELTDWFRDAMRRMETLLDDDTRHKVMEACACCTGGKRHEMAKMICKDNNSLESRVRALGETSYIVGRSAELLKDGRVRVTFGTTAEGGAWCPCLVVSDDLMPVTHCYCCGGHIKHHVQTALDVKANCTVVSSLLSSGGKKPCMFEFEIIPK